MKGRPLDVTCQFCLSNELLTGDLVAQSTKAFVIPASTVAGSYLIVPKAHYEALDELPDDWWIDVKTLLRQLPVLQQDYNLSINIGKEAGQKLRHLHFWVIPRQAGTPASTKGLAALIAEVNDPK